MGVRAVVIGAMIGALAGWATADQKPFNAELWQAPPAEKTRLSMADDLVRSRLLVGRSRDEVQALLGSPTDTDKWQDWDMIYILAPCRCLFPIDYEWLVLRLEDDRVTDARVVID